MDKILIFSGTSEGREISEYLSEFKIKHKIFVATDYGKIVMKKSPFVEIIEGRLNEEDMVQLFMTEQPEAVVDATHPYAIEVSSNIKRALKKAGYFKSYVRVSRRIERAEGKNTENNNDLKVVSSTTEAIEFLKTTEGNILLTTGVKTLEKYALEDDLKTRLIARILPSLESLQLAYSSKLLPKQIVAMEGPFNTSFNEALIEQYDIKVLVTKNSGAKGGFDEKIEACKNKGIKALVIEASKDENVSDGISVDEAEKMLVKKAKLTVVGIGVGNEKSLTLEGINAIKKAKLLIGAPRMLEVAKKYNSTALCVNQYEKNEVIKAIIKAGFDFNVFLVSGDTGFFSGATALKEAAKNSCVPLCVEILPGISSISYFCARINIAYSNALLLSSHGRKLDVSECVANKKDFFALTSGRDDFNRIVTDVLENTCDVTIYKGYNLGSENEEVCKYTNDSFIAADKEGLYVVGILFNKDN